MNRSIGRASLTRVGVLAVALASPPHISADSVFDAQGFDRNRTFFSQLPYEHIDPLNGNLLLTFTDLVLPGDAGFDLSIQRTYNSKLYPNYHAGQRVPSEDTWAGVGWTLHLGRIPAGGFPSPDVPPAIEMSDGSRHALYHHADGSGRFVTKDHWIYDKTSRVLKLPNGVEYTFGQSVSIVGGNYYYTTLITDPHGNRITVQYMNPASGLPADGIQSITQTVGGSTRVVTFGVTGDATKRVSSMRYGGRTWSYGGSAVLSTYSQLTSVTPPTGPGWAFSYYGSNATLALPYGLRTLTTPFGGTISYEHQTVQFNLGSTVPVNSPVVSRRTTGGTDIAAGVWTYQYAQGPVRDQTVISGPCSTSVHTFSGVGRYTTLGEAWRVGLPTRRQVKEGAEVLEIEDLTWQASVPISFDEEFIGFNHDPDIYLPLVQTRTVTRGSKLYRTMNAYRPTNYNDYGRPWTIAEAGELSRTSTLTYAYGFSPRYIVDKILSETVQVGSESFTNSYAYNAATGFRTSETIRGITRTSTADSHGNVATITDAHGHVRSQQYSWGQLSRVQTPTHNPLLTRVINSDGTIQSETRRGQTTSFQYDLLFRPTRTTPPAGFGNPIATTYDLVESNRRYTRVSRGASFTETFLDGIGRSSATRNSVGVKTNTDYDACGRTSYQSLPFTTADTGTSFQYDGLDRLTQRRNPDATSASYSYSDGIDVTVVDERGNETSQDWSAFGDPGDKRLVTATDATGSIWSYSYNALGSLTRVHPPLGADRTWTYYGSEADGKPGLLKSETHPESGTTTYTYDVAGLMRTRTDAQFGQTSFGYDADDRLISVRRSAAPYDETAAAYDTAYDTTMSWDESGNRTGLANGYVSSVFGYDGANRLIRRTDTVNGRSFTTSFSFDGNDNVTGINYPSPSGLQVRYQYDSENRVTDVREAGSTTAWASAFVYHPSGAPSSFRTGDGRMHTQTFTARHWPDVISSGAGRLDYGYDAAGNVTTLEDSVAGVTERFTYDPLDRMATANGRWGSGSFAYDQAGNRLSKSIGGASTSYSTDSSGRLRSAGGIEADSYTYDANGNLLTSTGRSYSYTPVNMLETATVDGVATTYRYDGDEMRAVKVQGDRTSYYVHDVKGQLLSELEKACGAGPLRPVRDYVYAGGRLVALLEGGSGDVTISFVASSSMTAAEGGSHAVDVQITTPDGSPTACEASVGLAVTTATATLGKDFTLLPGTLVFPVGTPSGGTQRIAATIASDALDEDGESFSVQLLGPTGASLGLATHTVTIVDDDPTPTVSIGPATTTVGEGDSGLVPVTLTVSLSAVSGREVRVNYATSPGTATAGTDYQNASRTLVFPAEGGSSQTVVVNVVGDTNRELDEDFTVALSAPVNATLAGAPARVVIRNDDIPTVRLIRPNGGESLPAGSIQTISWTSVHLSASGLIKLVYTDGTSTYPIVSGLARTALSYNWTVPDTQASSWRVTVCSDVSGSCEAQDASDGVFSITAAVSASPRLDWNGDGKNDLLLRYPTTGDLVAWYLDGVTKTGGAALSAKPGSLDWVPVGVADFNSDGKADVLFRSQAGGDLVVWYMNGVTKVGGAGLVPAKPGSLDWVAVGVADFNSDGKADVLFRSQSGGDLVVWYMNGVTKTGGAGLSAKPGSLDWTPVGVADFNGDGKADILFRHRTTGQHVVWYLDGVTKTGGAELQPTSPADSRWQVVALGDYSRDGKTDIVWQLAATGDLSVWFLEGVTKVGGSSTSPAQVAPPWQVVAPR